MPKNIPQAAKDIAWKAQQRLCKRYRKLLGKGKKPQVAITAVARELLGFMWAIARALASETVPKRSVVARPEAQIDLSKIRVVEDAATKEEAGRGPSGKRLRTLLVVRALTGDPAAVADTWADVHVFDAAGEGPNSKFFL